MHLDWTTSLAEFPISSRVRPDVSNYLSEAWNFHGSFSVHNFTSAHPPPDFPATSHARGHNVGIVPNTLQRLHTTISALFPSYRRRHPSEQKAARSTNHTSWTLTRPERQRREVHVTAKEGSLVSNPDRLEDAIGVRIPALQTAAANMSAKNHTPDTGSIATNWAEYVHSHSASCALSTTLASSITAHIDWQIILNSCGMSGKKSRLTTESNPCHASSLSKTEMECPWTNCPNGRTTHRPAAQSLLAALFGVAIRRLRKRDALNSPISPGLSASRHEVRPQTELNGRGGRNPVRTGCEPGAGNPGRTRGHPSIIHSRGEPRAILLSSDPGGSWRILGPSIYWGLSQVIDSTTLASTDR